MLFPLLLLTTCLSYSTSLAQKKTVEFTFGAGLSHVSKPQSHPDKWKQGLNFGGSAGVFVTNRVLLGFRFAYSRFGVESRPGITVRGGELAIGELLPVVKHYTRPTDSKINIYTIAGIGAVTVAEAFRFVGEGDNQTTDPGSGRHGWMTTAGLGFTVTLGKTTRPNATSATAC